MVTFVLDSDVDEIGSSPLPVALPVPPLPSNYVDRPAEEKALESMLHHEQGKAACVILEGTGGSGKSVLAAKVVSTEAIQLEYPDGVLWIHVGDEHVSTFGKEQQLDILMEKLRTYLNGGKTTASEDETAIVKSNPAQDEVRAYFENKNALLVLDHVGEDALDAVRRFHDIGVSVLLTTVKQVDDDETVDGLKLLPLETMTDEDAWKLFASSCGSEDTSFDEGGCPTVKQLVTKCRGHPFTVSMVASAVKFYLQSPHMPCSDIEDAAKKLDFAMASATEPTALNEQRHKFLYKCVATLLDSCTMDMRIHFLALAILPDGYHADVEMLWEIWGMESKNAAMQALSRLQSQYLIQGDISTGWSVHGMHLKHMKRKAQWFEGMAKVKERQLQHLCNKEVFKRIMREDVYSMLPLWNEVGGVEVVPTLWETNKESWDKEFVLSLFMFLFMVGLYDLLLEICDTVRKGIKKGFMALTVQSLTLIPIDAVAKQTNKLAAGLTEDEGFSYTVTRWKRMASNLKAREPKGSTGGVHPATKVVSQLPKIAYTVMEGADVDAIGVAFDILGSLMG